MRIAGIDVLRAIAVYIMLIANATPYLFPGVTNFVFRLICSCAAPIFIALSGYTFAIKPCKKKAINGFLIIISAVLIDILAWNIPPFQTFDVLYVIGFGQILLYFIYQFKVYTQVLILFCIFFVFIFLEWPYRFEIKDPTWDFIIPDVKRWLFDGWFPLWPWIVIVYFGYLLNIYKLKFNIFNAPTHIISTLLIMVSVFWIYHDKLNQPLRQGYVEIFYPLNLACISFALLINFLLIGLFTVIKNFNSLVLFCALPGKHSLFVYILHVILINYFIIPMTKIQLSVFWILICYFVFIVMGLFILNKILKSKKITLIPFWFRKILGLI